MLRRITSQCSHIDDRTTQQSGVPGNNIHRSSYNTSVGVQSKSPRDVNLNGTPENRATQNHALENEQIPSPLNVHVPGEVQAVIELARGVHRPDSLQGLARERRRVRRRRRRRWRRRRVIAVEEIRVVVVVINYREIGQGTERGAENQGIEDENHLYN
nr:hypothetical protein Iba_scaffold36119CG0010 [Ipomoea batatas]GMD86323.1 hypothetical protein Iba_chr14bCG4940 [Ipomoea batatas]